MKSAFWKNHNKVNLLIFTFIAIFSVIFQLFLINYGNPHQTHPDEDYIIKDSFIFLYKITHGQFDFIGNLYYYLLSAWYIFMYLFGILLGYWHSLPEFQTHVVSGSFEIYYMGRVLSVLLVLISNMIIFKTIKFPKTSTLIFVLIIVFFNPLVWLSTSWIKLDALSYLFVALIFNVWVRDLGDNPIPLKNKILIFALALSVRVDFLSFFLGYIFSLLLKSPKRKLIFQTAKFSVLTFGLYLIITNSVVNFLMQYFGIIHSPSMAKSIDQNIISKLMSLSLADVLRIFAFNWMFYSRVFLLTIFIPAILLLATNKNDAWRLFKEFVKYCGLLLVIISVFPYHAIHYVSTSYTFFLLLILFSMVNFQKSKIVLPIVASLFLFYFSTLFYDISQQTEPRLEATNYILSNSDSNSIIAIEDFQNPGFHPFIEECPEVLLLKSKEVVKYGKGTGEAFRIAAEKQYPQCRRVIEITSENRFSPSQYAMDWINVYDAESLIIENPQYIVSKKDFELEKSQFFVELLKDYKLKRSFLTNNFCFTTQILTENEPYNVSFYLYERE